MDSNLKGLFISYLENSISPNDEEKLIQYFKAHPEQINEFRRLKLLWHSSEVSSKVDNRWIEHSWEKLLQQLNESQNKPSRGNVRILNIWQIAAVFLLGAVITFAISYQVFRGHKNQLTFHEITTPPGAKSKVTLPDGTEIWLNAGSNLKYANNYGEKNREIELQGEAFFNVSHNPSKVFLVKTSEINIKAYGTQFNVKSYPEEGTIEATLIEGSIGVTRKRFENKPTDEVMLEPNQRVVYYKKNYQIKKELADNSLAEKAVPATRKEQKLTYLISKGINTEEFTSWKNGTLFITSETLQDLAVILERKYDVKIHFNDESLKNLKFTGSLENETVEQVIEAIGIAAKIDYEIDERNIWLKSRTKTN